MFRKIRFWWGYHWGSLISRVCALAYYLGMSSDDDHWILDWKTDEEDNIIYISYTKPKHVI